METNYDVYRAKTGLAKRMRVLLSGPGLIGKKHAELLAQSDQSLPEGRSARTGFCSETLGPTIPPLARAELPLI